MAASEVSLSAVFAYWKDFDLDSRRSKLDEVGLKVADLQEQSAANRKQLADATKEFKRNSSSSAAASDAEYVKAVSSLLKRYQEEIDALTRRAKHGEGAFLDLYQQLSEAPDPAPALAAAFDAEAQLAQLMAQTQKVSAELAEYKAESKAIKNQDLTIRKQEETIRELSAALEAKEQEVKETKQQAAAEADAALLQKMQTREAELAEMLSATQSSLEAMQRLYAAAQNQLFELQSTKEAVAAGRQEEMELAAAELEAVQARLVALEAEKHNLQTKLEANRQEAAATTEGASPASSSVEDTLRQELNSQREVSARLRQDLAAARQQLHDTTALWEERCSAFQEQVLQQEAELQQLQLELQHRPTAARVAELQQQIRVLQAVGYGSLPEEDLGVAAAAAAGSGSGTATGDAFAGGGASRLVSDAGTPSASGVEGGMNLEGLLLGKNRKLEHEVTVARLALAEANQQLEAAQEQVSDLQDQLQQKSDLIAQLEEDLVTIRQGSSGPKAAASLAGGAGSSSLDGQSPAAARAASNDLVRATSSAVAAAAVGIGDWGSSAAEATGGEGDSMLRVLVGQRDRLRAKVQELEVALAAAKSEAASAQQQLAAARADNVALIERLRYVGGYRQQLAAARNKVGAGGDLEKGSDADVVGKYSQLYDEGINPFKEFQGQQREQKRKQMSVADKAMYSMGSLVYQSPAARLLAFGYLVVMHLLVFLTMTHMTHRTSGHLMTHQDLILSNRHDLTGAMHGSFPVHMELGPPSPLQLMPPPPPPG